MKHLAWALAVIGALWGCADDSDTKPSYSLDRDVQPSRSRPLVTDPVCGEMVDPATPFRGEYRDNLYYFHSNDCRATFSAAPDYYAYGLIPPRGTRVEGKVALYPDPVCGRETPPTRWSTTYGGRVYYFHDPDCLLEFRFRPQAYLSPDLQKEAK
jgi:YHS domain-containing protein